MSRRTSPFSRQNPTTVRFNFGLRVRQLRVQAPRVQEVCYPTFMRHKLGDDVLLLLYLSYISHDLLTT